MRDLVKFADTKPSADIRDNTYVDNIVNEQAMVAKGYHECSESEWAIQISRVCSNAESRMRRLSTHYYLATKNSLQMWDRSARKILRVPPNKIYPNGVVGLLLFSK